MNEPKIKVNKFYARLKSNPVIATLIISGSIIVALSTFTDAASNLLGFVDKTSRPALNGVWRAEVTYDWPEAKYTETFTLKGEGNDLYGTASFLGTGRGILEGEIKENRFEFITITGEVIGSEKAKDSIHHYRGKIFPDKIMFVMQTKGGYSSHVPVEFIAFRVPQQE